MLLRPQFLRDATLDQARDQAERPCAVLTDVDCITGLQTARILAAKGVPVIGLARNPSHFCCRTNTVRRLVEADTRGAGLIPALRAIGAKLREPAVLFPCSDDAVLTVSREREHLVDDYHVVMPEAETMELLVLKSRFYRHALAAGWPIPPTHFLRTRADAEALVGEIAYPAVLKPPLKTPEWVEHLAVKVVKVEDDRELLEEYDRCSPFADELILQEWVAGGDQDMYACYSYLDVHSEPVWSFVARKVRQWPPETGSGSLAVSVDCAPIVEKTLRVLRDVRFRGLSFLQFKRDSRTGEYQIIEPNVGRPGLGMPIAEAAGIETMYTQYCDALGLPLPVPAEGRSSDVKWICWKRDLASAFHYWRNGELSLGQWWRSTRGKKQRAIFAWGDLSPFVVDVAQRAASLWRRGG